MEKSNNSWILTTPKPAKAEIKEIYVGVICEDQSQTNRSFVLTSAQLSRLEDHDLANSVRNGGNPSFCPGHLPLAEVVMFES